MSTALQLLLVSVTLFFQSSAAVNGVSNDPNVFGNALNSWTKLRPSGWDARPNLLIHLHPTDIRYS